MPGAADDGRSRAPRSPAPAAAAHQRVDRVPGEADRRRSRPRRRWRPPRPPPACGGRTGGRWSGGASAKRSTTSPMTLAAASASEWIASLAMASEPDQPRTAALAGEHRHVEDQDAEEDAAHRRPRAASRRALGGAVPAGGRHRWAAPAWPRSRPSFARPRLAPSAAPARAPPGPSRARGAPSPRRRCRGSGGAGRGGRGRP